MADQGEMSEREVIYEKLSGEVSVVSWSALAPHAERGALFWVDRQLDLAEVATCMALDEARIDGKMINMAPIWAEFDKFGLRE